MVLSSLLTCARWSHQHSNGLHEKHQADGTGELLGTDNGHEDFELQCPHHAVGDAKEDAEDHQSVVVLGLRANKGK